MGFIKSTSATAVSLERSLLLITSFLISISFCAYARQATGLTESEAHPPHLGNFALPQSQQPGPFFSFGQNILEKNQFQAYLQTTYEQRRLAYFTWATPALVYGVTDAISVMVALPIAIEYAETLHHSSGLDEAFVQGEWAFYNRSSFKSTEQGTLVGAVNFPTGSTKKEPSTSYGVTSYFIGGTYNQTFVNWLWFVSAAAFHVPPYEATHRYNQYLYQYGLGRNIKSVTNKYIFFGLLEFNGNYEEIKEIQIKHHHHVPEKSTIYKYGNVIYATPSLWFSTPKLFAQLGFSLPLDQQWTDINKHKNYFVSLALGLTFN
ncbi:MAG: hypothetical protein A3E88_07425 [Legionellales bacterium RIFCSPHIGHO2_12_FULL_35_11]|nr:MAG: hypothetical protein A3E88_07425 [Legionellales bacterium RIFCSPHIGHO2_12_FULL_35_11]